MKPLETIFILACALLCTGGVYAQTDAQTAAEQEFAKAVVALCERLAEQQDSMNYQACEAICQQAIDLYEQQKAQLPERYVNLKYTNYYNLACYQALQGKKQEAIGSLARALADGKLTMSYRQVMNDEYLKGILDAKELEVPLAKLKEKSDYLGMLQDAPAYTRLTSTDSLPTIVYAPATDSSLMRVRQYFRLDSVARDANSEIDTIKCLMTYIHNKIRHDGQHGNPADGANSIHYAEACKDGSRGLNCRGLAAVLNECYLSMGITSRVITCLPKTYVNDCHVINAVYSRTLGKWLWVDPTNNAWVTDEQGRLLSVSEVRERLRDGRPVQVNKEANWNNQRPTTTEHYLYEYMAKNLYYLDCWTQYGFDTESKSNKHLNYIYLQPTGCDCSERDAHNYIVNDDDYFWQAPQ